MMLCYILEFGGIKEVDEMLALELSNYDEALGWVIESLNCDAEYYDTKISIKTFETLQYDNYESETNFHAIALLLIEADEKVGIDTSEDESSDMVKIIESSLNVVSRIVNSGQLEERI